jgi:hypothetical protein
MFSDAGSKQGTDPQLGALADNGGPVDTRLPAPGGPAFDTGGATSCPAADARGIVRPQAAACDIGAVELFPPTATTLAATEIGVTTATLAGTATTSPLSASTATFEYGTTTAYGQSTAAQAVPAGSSGLALSAALSGLSPSSTYHARLVVQGREGTARGADITFTTAAPPAPPPPPALPELVISHLRVKHRCVRAATVSSPKPGGSGLSFSYRLSEPATVTFAILRRVHSPRWLVCPRRGGTFPVTFAPLTSHTGSGSGGAQSTTLATGKTVGRTAAMAAASRLRLPAGTYLLRLTARTADGRTSRPAEVNFWVVTARRRAAHHHSAGSAAAPSRR